MRKKILAFLTTILFACANLQAAPTHEGAANNAQPVVLYGKTSGGALKAFRTDSDGNIQTSGGGAGPLETTVLYGDGTKTGPTNGAIRQL